MRSITKQILQYKKSGKVLDLGCGRAQIGTELLEKGFSVTFVDISKEKIAKLEKLKAIKVIADLNNYKIEEKYDLILSLGIMHFLLRKKALELINEMQEQTRKGGINVIDAFVGKEYFREGELKSIYEDWEILDFESYVDKEKNKIEWIMARK